MAIALSGLTAGGLLLVEGTGLLRGAATVLALQVGALAAGAWSAEDTPGEALPDALRLWWTGALGAMALAAALTTFWQFRGLPGAPVYRGLGLGVLVGLPQLTLGGTAALLSRGRRTASALLAGSAAGFFLGGTVVLPHLPPAATLFGCMVVLGLSAGMHAALGGEAGADGGEPAP